jgi:hypothetical protein
MHEVLSKTQTNRQKRRWKKKGYSPFGIHLARKKKEDCGAAKTREYTRQP